MVAGAYGKHLTCQNVIIQQSAYTNSADFSRRVRKVIGTAIRSTCERPELCGLLTR
jgi:hypothetical protein